MTIQFSNGHALVIGVGADLPNTVQDAHGIAAILGDPTRCAYPAQQVRVLTAEQSTRGNLLGSFTDFSASTDANSTALIYYSGHGYCVSGEYFLLPYGYDLKDLATTAISGKEFSSFLSSIRARKLLVLLDCCHAGGLEGAKAPGLVVEKAAMPFALDVLDRGRGRVGIASSHANEVSLAGRPYSVFTLALIETLSGRENAHEDGYVRIADLVTHAAKIVPQRTRNRQNPVFWFDQADNFAVAYYAAGEKEPKGLPFKEEPQIEIEPGNWVPTERSAAPLFHQPGWQVNTVIQPVGNVTIEKIENQEFNRPAPGSGGDKPEH